MQYDCELVLAENEEYLFWLSSSIRKKSEPEGGYVNDKDLDRHNRERNLTFQFQKWELVLRKIVNNYISEYPYRILKHKIETKKIRFKEIDFVQELGESLVFYEFKFRNHCDVKSMSSSVYKKGWKQLESSRLIAQKRYSIKNICLIIVDMSFVYGIPYIESEEQPNYARLESVGNYEYIDGVCHLKGTADESVESLRYKGRKINLIWIDSKEMVDIAKYKDLLTENDVFHLREAYGARDSHRESISFSTDADGIDGKAFSKLRGLTERAAGT